MLRFLFPKISFSGRLDRMGFWRELMVSAITTPIAVAIVTQIVQQGARAAEHGLVVDNIRAKAAVGLLLTIYALRNFLVFAGVVRRRLNDLGLEGMRVFKPAVPLFVFFGIMGMVTLIKAAPAGIERQAAVGLLTFALVAVVLWQVLGAFNIGFQVMFGRSNALAGRRTAPSVQEAMKGAMPKDIQNAAAGLRAQFDTAVKRLNVSTSGKPGGFEAIDQLFAPVMEALNEWGKPATANAGGRANGREARAQDSRDETHMRLQRIPVRPADNGRAAYKKSAVAARHEPRSGRSRWYDGLLAGPWG